MSEVILRNFLEIPYDELEAKNLEAKEKALNRVPADKLQDEYTKYLHDEKRIKAVTICFTDIEGRFHMIDYDKKFLLKSMDNLTFDGSSVRGFSQVRESDLRIEIDWSTFRWAPTDVFGPGKVMVFAIIRDRQGGLYSADMRGVLKQYSEALYKKDGTTVQVSVECEGFLFQGTNAEQHYAENGFQLVASGGYYNSLPKDPLRQFIDAFAEAQRAMGFENEKDHPEVAPSQFELNYLYTDALLAADQLQMYKLLARQIAANMGMTACFLPKPITGINGNGMHTNMSLQRKGKNLFWDEKGEDHLSTFAWGFVDRILNNADDLCLILNPSVNAYRRLDPHFEAPNQIKSSAVDRTSMIRIPLGNERSARIEVRSVGPDANPYMAFYSLIRAGLDGPMNEQITSETRRTRTKFLPDNIYDSIRLFKQSAFMGEVLGDDVKEKFVQRKIAVADRSPKELGTIVKPGEILFHHEVTNQYLWSLF